jgi:nucleoside-diphosphate-sugar epimerase
MKSVLVTGGTGFIGACLVRRLLAGGHAVHLLVRPQHGLWRIADIVADLRLHTLDLDDAPAVQASLAAARPDWIFHLAVHGAYPRQTGVDAMIRTNIAGTAVLLEAAAKQGFDAFVNAGSSSEYGFRGEPAREVDAPDPNSAYAVTKVASTLMCRHVGRSTGAQVRTLRLYSVYGPFEDPTRLLPRLVVAAITNRLPPLTDPRTARDFVYVDDVVEAFLAAATADVKEPGAIFNICSGVQTTLHEVVEMCRTEFRVTAPANWGASPSRSWDTSCWVGDPSKAAEHLHWQSTTDLRTGARAFLEWLEGRPDLLPRYLEATGGDAAST